MGLESTSSIFERCKDHIRMGLECDLRFLHGGSPTPTGLACPKPESTLPDPFDRQRLPPLRRDPCGYGTSFLDSKNNTRRTRCSGKLCSPRQSNRNLCKKSLARQPSHLDHLWGVSELPWHRPDERKNKPAMVSGSYSKGEPIRAASRDLKDDV